MTLPMSQWRKGLRVWCNYDPTPWYIDETEYRAKKLPVVGWGHIVSPATRDGCFQLKLDSGATEWYHEAYLIPERDPLRLVRRHRVDKPHLRIPK